MKTTHNKIFSLAGLLLLLSVSAFAQRSPVSWSFRADKVEGDTYQLVFTADVDNGWYIYSQHLDEGGPIPTSFSFEESKHFELLGETGEEARKRKEGMDELFGMNVIKFGEQAVFTQRIRVEDPSQPVKGSLEFMTCDDEQCLPPKTAPFEITLE